MIWFPKIGDAVEDRAQPGALFSVVGVRRSAPTRTFQFETWELELLCVIPGDGPYGVSTLGQAHHTRGTLAYMRAQHPCLNV